MSTAATPTPGGGDGRGGDVSGSATTPATGARDGARGSDAAPAPSTARGQTLPDFAVAVSVFLVAIAFVTVFVPQLVVPFDGAERPVVAERVGTDLASDELVGNGTDGALNETATRSFFALNESDALARFGVGRWYSLNVTLRDAPGREPDATVLCVGSGSEFWITDCGADDDRFAVGPSVPDSDRSVATARRTVYAVDAGADRTEYVVLEVHIW